MPQTETRWTAELVRALPDDGKRYELVSGELVVTPAPAPLHQGILAALYNRMSPYLQGNGAGRILWSPADLAFGEDEILQPDLFVLPASLPLGFRNWSEVTSLLLAIEVLSPSTARYDRILKRKRYQRGGVPEYWIVDPDARVVERWRPSDERPEVISELLEWRPLSDSPPLLLDLPALFAEGWGERVGGTG
ncbi:MAG TPA: Uma2 family endonuclease [Gemmatimonadales bacterium]|nr:Uma2 family endonuclease [Gemmatimonadales bacterium]